MRRVLLAALLLVVAAVPARPCSRVVWADNGAAVVVARSMDWINKLPTDLYTSPRGVARDGQTGPNTLRWTAKYGSLAAVSGAGGVGAPADGLNEAGLTGSLLWLVESDYGPYRPDVPSLSLALWLQYYLDQFATVAEAVTFTNQSQLHLIGGGFDGQKTTVHLALTDPTGDTAVIEYVGGKPKVYHGKQYPVMTNSPPFDQQLTRLAGYKGFGGDKPLPGTTDAADRFVRGAYYMKNLPKPADTREAVAGALSVLRNISQPFGEADPARPNISATRWRTVADLTNKVYFFESATSPNLAWVKLSGLDFGPAAGVRKLDLTGAPDRVGDCTAGFVPAKPLPLPPAELK